ncbi:Variable major outer membrane lipoprotein (plasmid) [Borrelia coriaceae ATCC 43381]|uniref:Variable large protein n=1 Tax=Borrelia coriaceae ATCC 43381 TaxID=1408429 RepID=W5SY20_9SPIR|nr:Variable major outer membrane lipoprotein [Borrelia coriaceae ATCC 43381]
MAFAKGTNTAADLAKTAAKASEVAGGIALRSLVKEGKLASHTSGNDDKAVQAVGINAANKLLGAVENVIGKTINKILEKVKAEINEIRKSKAVGQ